MAKESTMSIRLTAELKLLLDEHTKELDLTRSQLIRLAINHYLKHLQTGAVRQKFLDEFEKKGTDIAAILSEAIRDYIAESEAARIEAKPQSEVEVNILKLEGL